MSKHMIMLQDAVVQECLQFLELCEGELQEHHCSTAPTFDLALFQLLSSWSPAVYGTEVPAFIEQPLDQVQTHIGKNTVTYEARLLKSLFYEVTGWNK